MKKKTIAISFILLGALVGCASSDSSMSSSSNLEVPKTDFSSPEASLAGYFTCLQAGDEKCVRQYLHQNDDFTIAQSVDLQYSITQKIFYKQNEVDRWNNAGIIPAAMLGDVQLNVSETYPSNPDNPAKGFYNFRNIQGKWLIYAYSVELK